MRPRLEHRTQRFHATHGARIAWKSEPSWTRVQSRLRDQRESKTHVRIEPLIRRANMPLSQHRISLSRLGRANARSAALRSRPRGYDSRSLAPRACLDRARLVLRRCRALPPKSRQRRRRHPLRRQRIREVMGLRVCRPASVTSERLSPARCRPPTTQIPCGQHFPSGGSAAWQFACV